MKIVQLHRWQVVGAFIAVTLAFVVVAVLLTNQGNEIQRERREAVIRNCQDQNQRHDATISELDKLAAKIIRQHPDKAKQIQQSIQENVLLINALVPKHNCEALADAAVK